MIKTNCFAIKGNKCIALKELYCRYKEWQTLTDCSAINEYCLYKDKSTCSVAYLFVLERTIYTYTYAVNL